MNCKPGDLAWVVSDKPELHGRLVEVLYATPDGNYILPDGYPAVHDKPGAYWVLKMIGGPVMAPIEPCGKRSTWYGSGADSKLRPIRGNPDEVDELVTAVSEIDGQS
jgi:hypothetical protein